MRRKGALLLALSVFLVLLRPLPGNARAADAAFSADPRCLNMILVLLLPSIGEAVDRYYEPYLSVAPTVTNYYGSKVTALRGGEPTGSGTYSGSFSVTVEVTPYIGPHIAVGEDRLTLSVSPSGAVTVESYEHLESGTLPPNLQPSLKRPLP